MKTCSAFYRHVAAILLVVIGAIIPVSTSLAQPKAGIQGIDHLGINVPDMPAAIQFFSDVLGFTAVTQIGPLPLDEAWKKQNRMNLGTGAITIKMLHAGTGASIELFAYENNKGSRLQPGGDDLGATHIAFYTTDINAALAYLKSKNVTVLGEPFVTPVGDTEGETWVYFLTPWGAKLELVSYANGKAYEKNNPVTVLWSPKNATVKTNTNTKEMSTAAINTLIERHLEIWNQKDETKRNTLMQDVYAKDVEMVDRHFTAEGQATVAGFVNTLQQQNPTYRFTNTKAIDIHHNIARLYWQFGSKEKPDAVTGMDVFVVEDGKINKLYVFVDGK